VHPSTGSGRSYRLRVQFRLRAQLQAQSAVSAQGAATGSERSYVLRAGDLVELVIIAADHQDR